MTVSTEPFTEPPDSHRGRRRVLICAARYLPGYKSGGPVRAIANMVTHLSPHFDFYIITRDRDATDTKRYPGIEPNRWCRVGNSRVLYCSSVGPAILRRAFHEVRPDLIILNSFQDTFTRVVVMLRRIGIFGDTPVILAPRGEFSPGALKIKRTKKTLYRLLAWLLGLHKKLLWQASTEGEKLHIMRAAPAWRINPDSIHVVNELSDAISSTAPHIAKDPGTLKLTFIGRMSEMKNLHFLYEILPEIRGEVRLNLFGPVAENDVAYWSRCKAMQSRLPANIQVEYHGALEHPCVPRVLHENHFFILPTRGENFCHAAAESFINGTPVILSDETPWIGLGKANAGFDIPLNDRHGWVDALQRCMDMTQETYSIYLMGAKEYSRRFEVESAVTQHLAMFESAFQTQSPSLYPND